MSDSDSSTSSLERKQRARVQKRLSKRYGGGPVTFSGATASDSSLPMNISRSKGRDKGKKVVEGGKGEARVVLPKKRNVSRDGEEPASKKKKLEATSQAVPSSSRNAVDPGFQSQKLAEEGSSSSNTVTASIAYPNSNSNITNPTADTCFAKPKSKPSQTSLHSYLALPSSSESSYVESPPLTDRGSIFISYAISTTSPSAPKSLISNLRRLHASSREGEASHYMYAYRVLVPRKGKTGAEGEGDDTWTVKEGEDDGNEKYGGETIRKEMERLGGVDATCVVVRWFGGTLLGPARFQHIRTVVSQSISLLNERIYIEGEIQKLKELDHWINELLLKTGGKEEDEKEYGVETMDRSRAERLMKARRGRKEMLEKKLKG